ncbi:uncharacterized protein LOC132270198 [Cornus florida]|uniref:uncharacterized protein LOC132270198 n=1 Tax=Cornus florida TaxID=4283 RepID=UPI00289670A7|nr:uncharacterized protein LOC132270198 [Cornus florida]
MNLLPSDEINFIDGEDEDDVMEVNNRGKRVASAGRMLEKEHPHLYWTPCAAHCLDLMLEDIGKIPSISRTMQRAVELNSYIYMRPKLLNIMRNFTHKKELLRVAKTRFATCFITLSSIHKQKNNLRKMFTSEEWNRSKWAKEEAGKRVASYVLMPSFWNNIIFSLKVSGPLIPVLRLVDSEKKPPMGYIYAAMDRAKEAIAKSFGEVEDKYKDIFEIIDKRCDVANFAGIGEASRPQRSTRSKSSSSSRLPTKGAGSSSVRLVDEDEDDSDEIEEDPKNYESFSDDQNDVMLIDDEGDI